MKFQQFLEEVAKEPRNFEEQRKMLTGGATFAKLNWKPCILQVGSVFSTKDFVIFLFLRLTARGIAR